jgi:hypothetical protein
MRSAGTSGFDSSADRRYCAKRGPMPRRTRIVLLIKTSRKCAVGGCNGFRGKIRGTLMRPLTISKPSIRMCPLMAPRFTSMQRVYQTRERRRRG